MKSNNNNIGSMCPELAELANTTNILTPAGWQVAHGLRKANVGEVLARPATKDELDTMTKKAAYEKAAMTIGAQRRAAKLANKAAGRKAVAEATKAAKTTKITEPVEATKVTVTNAGTELAKATTRREALEAHVEVLWAEKPADEIYDPIMRAFETAGIEAPKKGFLGLYLRKLAVWQQRVAYWTRKLREAKASEAKLRGFLKEAKQDNDPVIRGLARLGLTAQKSRKANNEEHGASGTYSYKVRVLDFVLPTKFSGYLAAMNSVKTEAEFMEYLGLAEEAVRNVKLGANVKRATVRTLRQSEGSEMFGVEPGALTQSLVLVEHDMYGRVYGPMAAKMTKKNIFVRERLAVLHERLVNRLIDGGLTLRTEDGNIRYVDVTANSSNAKKGSLMMAEEYAFKKALPFMTAGQDLATATKISGQEVYKGFAVDWTPSTPINLGTDDEPRYIRIEDCIMIPELTARVELDNPVVVGKEDNVLYVMMPVRKGSDVEVKIPVKVVDGKYVVDTTAFDGMGLAWIDMPIQQARGFGQKGLIGSVCAGEQTIDGFDNLIDWVAATFPELGGKVIDGKLHIVDIDGVEQVFKPGKVLLTTSMWKKKSFFTGENKPWAKCTANYIALRNRPTAAGTLWSTCGCLRSASEEEAEWDTDRQTSRQALQQCWGIEDRDITKLVSGTVGNAKAWKQFDTAMPRLAGAGKKADELTASEKVFRLVPELAAEKHVAGVAMNNFHRKIGDAGYMALDTKAINAFMASDPVAFVKAILRYAMTGNTDVTGITGLLGSDEISVADLAEGQEALTARYPMNAISMKLMKNRIIEVFAWFGRAAFVPFGTGFEQQHDGDFDGDHLYLFIAMLIISIWKKSQKLIDRFGLNGPVVFEHAEKEDRRPYDDAFIKAGKVSAIVNGQAFNLVGRFSKQATRFAALATDAIYHAERSTAEKARWNSVARMYGYIQTLFSVGAILCIDWAKKGVPEGGESRGVYNTCLKLLDWAPAYGHGAMPWQQAFADNETVTPYYALSQSEERTRRDGSKYRLYRYATPNNSVVDRVAMEVLEQGEIACNEQGEIDISSVSYDDMGVVFDPAMLGWSKTPSISNCVVNNDVFRYVDAETLQLGEDRKLMTKIQAGETISWRGFVEMLYRISMNMERKLANRVDEAEEAREAAEIRSRAKAACRALVLTAKITAVNTTGLSDYQLKINNIVDLALEITKTNNIGKNEPNEYAEATRKARFAGWLFDVFGEDVLASTQKANGLEVTANTKVVNLKKYGEYGETLVAFVDAPLTDEELLAMLPEDIVE